MGCIVSKLFLDFYIFFIFTRPLSGFAKLKKFQKSQKKIEVVGGSRSHSDKTKLENRPKISFASVQFAPAWRCTWRLKVYMHASRIL